MIEGLFAGCLVRNGGTDLVQVFVFGQDAADFAEDFAIGIDDDCGRNLLALQLEFFADDVMMADLLFRLEEFLWRVKIEENKRAFGDLLEIACVENAFAEADGCSIPIRTGI